MVQGGRHTGPTPLEEPPMPGRLALGPAAQPRRAAAQGGGGAEPAPAREAGQPLRSEAQRERRVRGAAGRWCDLHQSAPSRAGASAAMRCLLCRAS